MQRGRHCNSREAAGLAGAPAHSYPTPMLPADFQWIPRGQYANGDLALVCNGRHVALLMKRADGVTWMARLDSHQPISAPVVTRRCTSFESGKAGVESWAIRHVATLRAGLCVYQQREPEED